MPHFTRTARSSRQRLAHRTTAVPALRVIYADAHSPDEIVGVSGLNVPRLSHESATAYLARLDTHVRATRAHSLPLVVFAEYAVDV